MRRVIQFARKVGICVRASFIIGLPGSDMAFFKKSLTFAEKLKLSPAGWNILVPYPATETHNWMLREARILRPWEEGFLILVQYLSLCLKQTPSVKKR